MACAPGLVLHLAVRESSQPATLSLYHEAAVTVTVFLPDTPNSVAVMSEVPALTPDTRPDSDTVALAGVPDVQAACAVTSAVRPSIMVAVAVACAVCPTVTAGTVTAMDAIIDGLNPMTPSTAWPTGGKTRFIDPCFYAAAALLP